MASIVRWTARALMPQLTRIFETTTQIIGYLQTQGLTYRRQTMLDDIRVSQGRQEREAGWDVFPHWQEITEDRMVRVHLEGRSEYRVIGNVFWRDPETGELSQKMVSVYLDAVGNPMDVEDALEEEWLLWQQYWKMLFEGFSITDIWHNLTPAR